MRHDCGGELQPTKVKISKKIGYYFQTFTVDGFKCDQCGEEVITGEMAFQIDQAIEQLRQAWAGWRVPQSTMVTGTYVREQAMSEQIFEDNNYVPT